MLSKFKWIKDARWVAVIGIMSFFRAILMSVVSETILRNTGIITAFIVLITIILIGVMFDSVGIAVAASKEMTFHSMAANRVKEAKTAVRIVRNAGMVSSICNDVVGDICGIISGVATAIIITRMVAVYNIKDAALMSVLLSGLVASMTIGGKAMGKEIGIKKSDDIVYHLAIFIHVVESFLGVEILKLKNKKRQKGKKGR